jgi:hypothetical protein
LALDLTFQQVKEFLKKDQPTLIDTADRLLGLTLVCSPLVLGPIAAPLLGLVAVKNELTKAGVALFNAVARKKDSDFLAHQERLKAAYTLICYTAYFEAVDRQLPSGFRSRLSLAAEDRAAIAKSYDKSTQSAVSGGHASKTSSAKHGPLVSFPHPIQSLEDQKTELKSLYAHLSQGLIDFLEKLAIWEQCPASERDEVLKSLNAVPEIALAVYEAQYSELATQFEDFGVWANLHEHAATREIVQRLSTYVKERAVMAAEANNSIDIGFQKLQATVEQIPCLYDSARANDIVDALKRHYEARVNEPIIEDKYEPEEGKPRLSFPRIKEAFIPQSYRALVYQPQMRRLESEETWKSVPSRQDLGAFLLSYLSSPYSIEAPLIILGHPGSGKSLLTKVLSASLLSDQYTPIRVALREVDSEASIPSQVEQYINTITADKIDSWARFSSQFKNSPPVIILDGYDELLQASGKVFSGYLKDARNFQRSETEQGRPVRMIITSRLTLIDKASIPEGATILRLLDFDSRQRDAWTTIWKTRIKSTLRAAHLLLNRSPCLMRAICNRKAYLIWPSNRCSC